MKAGAPTKLTAERRKLLIACAREGLTQRAAARCAEIDTSTLVDWLKDPVFSAQYRKAEGDAERALLKCQRKKDPGWVLARRWPQSWGKKREEHKPVPAGGSERDFERLQGLLEQKTCGALISGGTCSLQANHGGVHEVRK